MALKEKESSNATTSQGKADQVEIIYYTDPLCCWSWAMEPQWRRLQFEFEGKINWRYVMGGLLPNWQNYNDEVNSVNRPAQMGPVWMQAGHMSGMPLPDKIWMFDPPTSSYPSCIAVKCAQLQSTLAGDRYLRLLREAIMIHQRNISKEAVLYNIAEELAAEQPAFDLLQFETDMKNDNGLEAFRTDLHQVQTRNINRFPTFIFRSGNNPALMTTGYRPYSTLLATIKQIAPAIQSTNTATNAQAYTQYWGSVTTREIEEALTK